MEKKEASFIPYKISRLAIGLLINVVIIFAVVVTMLALGDNELLTLWNNTPLYICIAVIVSSIIVLQGSWFMWVKKTKTRIVMSEEGIKMLISDKKSWQEIKEGKPASINNKLIACEEEGMVYFEIPTEKINKAYYTKRYFSKKLPIIPVLVIEHEGDNEVVETTVFGIHRFGLDILKEELGYTGSKYNKDGDDAIIEVGEPVIGELNAEVFEEDINK